MRAKIMLDQDAEKKLDFIAELERKYPINCTYSTATTRSGHSLGNKSQLGRKLLAPTKVSKMCFVCLLFKLKKSK
jgi:hypothetical protein